MTEQTLDATWALMADSLRFLVPLRISELRGYSEAERDRMRHGEPGMCGITLRDGEPCPCSSLADVVGTHGDDAMFGGNGCRGALNATVTAIALLSFAPGGVAAMGMHFCAGSGHFGTADLTPCDAELDKFERLHDDDEPPEPDVTETGPPLVVTLQPRGGVL
jgi:hypothetical protein